MDYTSGSELQQDQQLTGSVEQALAAHLRGALLDLHTCLPGRILSFDPATCLAVVQPLISRVFTSGVVNVPPCADVPVQFLAGGEFLVTVPVSAGDECLLVFAERGLDNWKKYGGIQAPARGRRHNYSDGFALLGVFNQTRVPINVSTTALEVRSLDGQTKVVVAPGAITLQAATVAVTGNLSVSGSVTAVGTVTAADVVNALNTSLTTHTHQPGGALPVVGS